MLTKRRANLILRALPFISIKGVLNIGQRRFVDRTEEILLFQCKQCVATLLQDDLALRRGM